MEHGRVGYIHTVSRTDARFTGLHSHFTLSLMASRKKKHPCRIVSYCEDPSTDSTPSLSFSSQVIGIGTASGSRRIRAVLAAKADDPPAVLPETPLEQLLGDLKLDPVEKAEQEAGISIKVKAKRYQTSVRIEPHPKVHRY